MPKAKPWKERRTVDGELIGFVDESVTPPVFYDVALRPVGKQMSIEDALKE